MLNPVNFKRALCVAAHPDDEVLGPGATLARLAQSGCDVHVLVLGEGVGARYDSNKRPTDQVAALSKQFEKAASVLGATPHQLSLPDNRFDSVDMLDIVHAIEKINESIDPDLVLTHHSGDMNVDHRVTCNAVLTAFRPVPKTRRVTILAFETLSSTEWNVYSNGPSFVPNWFEDASPGLDTKIRAMAAYTNELREWPHPRSLEGIRVAARRWGMTVGMDAAEPFMLLRRVASAINLRVAEPRDEERLLIWRNDPGVREAAFTQDEISAESHHTWFENKLADPACRIVVVEEDGTPVGQVRFDRLDDGRGEIHIAIAAEARGRGVGREALRLAVYRAPELIGAQHILARVKESNESSLRMFRSVGFVETARPDEVVELEHTRAGQSAGLTATHAGAA